MGGCLKKDGTYKKLVKKLECHFERVDVEGKGKNKVYVLIDPKSQPTAMDDKRKGREMPRKTEDKILTNYVHRMLIVLELIGKEGGLQSTTYNTLVVKIPFVRNQIKTLHDGVAKVFDGHLSDEKLKSVWSYTNWYLTDRAKKDIRLAIKHLVADKKIKVKTKWMASEYKSSKKVMIQQKKVDEINEAIRQLAIDHNINYTSYQRSFAFPSVSQSMRDFQSIVKSYLRVNFGYNYIYEALEIKVLDSTLEENVDYQDAKWVFLHKIYNLVADKVKSDKYLKAQNKGEKFHYLCILLFLRDNLFEVDNHALKEEIECIPYRLLEIISSFEEPKPKGFGRKNSSSNNSVI
ncbi:hypothetical protein AMS59_04590 [Lysinibacillus sp. FJAT-14745]|uniref:hypothetical protein n=1 Tax=Lysinibacillus sp. FJAT-14745 TaxID=1704289 RepID=UPI0006ABCF24|nr:hypothetical protein [Lysinibacillus sp. FJAT-14745]KOP80655.1 hypothetical protein AMS59_04590 [Lysinibacillus sp. FJAT-14745]